ncbi:MAG: membrane lipoprotein lipid attachment site-containing protein, partial [Candidatus Fermentibacteraceae bacterium]|nr:membrane lipoprotein lipid attachment site-containing protein [Candidatus Fermentibacteraceae bacterium]
MKRFVLGAVFLVVLAACNRTPETASSGGSTDTTIVRTIPDTPLDVGLRFSNNLGMNDPDCFTCLEPSLSDSVQSLQRSPWEIFGRWRGFDSGGRLTETVTGEDGRNRTSYYCSIARLEELPPVIRLDFVLIDGQWYIEQVESELPRDVIDSLSVQTQASLV